jgi:transcriptional regulator with PAS, ATPase and Fis domain
MAATDLDRVSNPPDNMLPDSAKGDLERERFFVPDCPPGVRIVGRSPSICKILDLIRLVAATPVDPILVVGDTGTGKELAAQAIHTLRKGADKPFVAVNCATLTANLLESELFGHVRGAFTGADREKTGLFEEAGDGTLFLDEISEMPVELQAKLLRVLQEKRFRKVGGTRDIPCYATIVASSNRDLLRESRAGTFRQDLYYRLAVFPIYLAPIRSAERRDDIPLLAEYFLETSALAGTGRACRLSDEARRRLLAHDWPGNVRELKNVIERALILERTDCITPDSLVLDVEARGAESQAAPLQMPEADFSLETAERLFITRALRETGWQRTRAAALLGITRATLHAKLKRYSITAPDGAAADVEPPSAEEGGELREACA